MIDSSSESPASAAPEEARQRINKKAGPSAAAVKGATDTANARAYETLKQAVHAGSFKSGEILTLRRLTETLAVGAMPVREAVKRLISEGAFEGLPNRSARVPIIDQREIQQLGELRMLLEPNAAALAANNITLHQIKQLRGMHDSMCACTAAQDFPGYKQLNMAFHFEIYRIADNKPLANLIDALWLRMAPFISRWINWMEANPSGFDRIANCHHEELLVAFQNRDAEAARLAMQRDLEEGPNTQQYWDAMNA